MFYSEFRGADVITDFTRTGPNPDKIVIGFGDLASGLLGGGAVLFRVPTIWRRMRGTGSSSAPPTTRCGRNQDGTGTLFAPVLLATLNVAALSAGDILIL